MCDRAMAIKKYEHPDEAQGDIVMTMNYVMDTYQSVGGIITEIDRKHSTYTKSSIEKIRYLMTVDQTIEGKLAQLLKTYAAGDAIQQESIGVMMEPIKNGYPISRVCAYVDKLLEHGNSEITSENITINEDSDFILLLLAILRANDPEATYTVELTDGTIARNGYQIPCMIIRKKDELHHVE